MKMNKKAILKLGIVASSFLILVFLMFMLLSIIFSSASDVKEYYILGEKVKIELEKNGEYTIKIISPSKSYRNQISGKSFVFKPEEIGEHDIFIEKTDLKEKYHFTVINEEKFKENKNALRPVDVQNNAIYKEEEVIQENKNSEEEQIMNIESFLIGKEIKITLEKADLNSDSKQTKLYYDEEETDISISTFKENDKTNIIIADKYIKPGIYTIKFDSNGIISEKKFAYGLISFNTKKRIQRIDDVVEFEIVVLNSEGRGACDAKIEMAILHENESTNLSTDKEISSSEECGLYYAQYQTKNEGNYSVKIKTEVDSYQLNFADFFVVDNSFPFEIIRETQSKIDPTQENKFKVNIHIKSLTEEKITEVKEYVPSVFEVHAQDNVKIKTEGDKKILTWNIEDKEAILTYSYSVPQIWPYLYTLGELEINTVKEPRPWYIAVDPAFSVDNVPSQDIALGALDNNTFIISWINASSLLIKVYDTNGTNITGTLTVASGATNGIDLESQVSVVAINSTNFIIAWDDGDAGSEDALARGYTRNGSNWFAAFQVEARVGTPAVDINLIAMVDRYHACYIDDAESDADLHTYLYSAPTTLNGAEVNLDGGANPDTALQNQFECAAINSTRFAAVWFDESANTTAYSILNQDRTIIVAQQNLDAVGGTAQVATTTLNQNAFAIGYYDSVNNAIKVAIRDVNNNAILGITTIDTNPGTTTKVAMATVYNRQENSDWFIMAWNDRDAGAINATVFNATGSQKYHYTLVTDENDTSFLFDIYGKDSLRGEGICDESYILAYTNNTGSVVAKTLKLNGAEWSGYCDFINPLVNITSPQNTTYASSSINFTINVTDSTTITAFYTLNNGAINYTLSTTDNKIFNATNASIADGSYKAYFYVLDVNNNSNLTESIAFSVDTTPPRITINSPQPNNVNYSVSNVLFNITLDNAGQSCLYTLNAGVDNISMSSANNINWNATNASIADGIYTTNFYCNDTLGNLGTNTTIFRIDTLPPNIIISHPQAINYTTNSLSLNFTINDVGVGKDSCWYSTDSGSTNNTLLNCQNATFTAQQGTTTLRFYANDTLNNRNLTQNVTFFVDSIIPLIEFKQPTPLNGTSRDDNFIFVNVSLTETNFANITYELYNISGGSNHLVNRTIYTTPITTINWTNLNKSYMNYTYNVSISDILDNKNNTETRTITLTLGDTAPPDIFFNSPDNEGDYFNASSVYFEVTLSEEGNTVWYQINTSVTNYSMLTTNNLTWNATNTSIADGHYQIIAFANDSFGNLGNRRRNFSIDTIYPLIDFGIGTENSGVNISRNWIYANVTVTEINEQKINFTLYNSVHSIINSTVFTDGTRTINWTLLSDGNYEYNVTITDKADNFNSTQTKTIRLDTTNPKADLISPANGFYSNVATQNLTVNSTDNIGLYNLTLRIYNISDNLINQTTVDNFGASYLLGIQVTLPYDGNFSWSYEVRDSANNINLTVNRTLIVDTLNPALNFTSPTLSNASVVEQEYIFVNVSITETNFANITFELYNNTNGQTLVNKTTYVILTQTINWSSLSSLNVTYFYNVTVTDLANNKNNTETRTTKLADLTSPSLSILSPQNKTYFTNDSLLLNFTVSDLHLADCWYNLNQGTNATIPNCQNVTFNVSEGSNIIYLFANDSLGLTSTQQVTFIANSSLLQRRKGILVYGEDVIGMPRYRFWNGTGFDTESIANSVGGTIEWLRVKNSPSRDEQIIIAATNADDIAVQINSTLPGASTICWHNGSTCNEVLNLTSASTIVNRLKADVAYETTGEEAIIVWSDNDATPQYQIWNGTSWSVNQTIPQTLITGNIISHLKMASHPFREEIALIMTNTTALNVLIWNGTSWGCEPSSLRSQILTQEEYQHADLAYEQSSGDLFVVSSVDGITEFDYTTKQDGSCSYTTSRTTTFREEAETLVVNAKYESNYIMITGHDITGADMDTVAWTGTGFSNIPAPDTSTYATAVPNLLMASGWAGTSDYGLSIYSDGAPSLNPDYFRYNVSNNAWEDGAGAGLDASGLTAFSDEEQNIKAYSSIEENRTLIIVQDDLDDLWAKSYDGDTNTWLQPDGGINLSDNVSSTTFPSFDFEFNYDRAGPSITKISPREYVNSSDALLNITIGETATSCTYSIDGGATQSMSATAIKTFSTTAASLSSSVHNVSFTCEDVWENSRTTEQFLFTVDTILPLVNFASPTESNGTIIERDWIFVNVSITETNEANITFMLFNTTSLVNQTIYSAGNRAINWTNLPSGLYFYNVTVIDLANNKNNTETRTTNLTRLSPFISLIYPSNNQNFSSFIITQFNFSVSDNSSIINCSLYGNWTGTWHLNQTINNPTKDTILNFSSVTTAGDNFYGWNVECFDEFNISAFNVTNFTFATFLFPDKPVLFNISQNANNGNSNITLFWNSSNHSLTYRIYYADNLTSPYSLLNETTSLNYTDTSFSGVMRRFYRIDSFNPTGQNNSSQFFGAHVYTLGHNGNTRNWISFPTNASYLKTANDSLMNIRNATTFTMWNSTIQRRITCNLFSCPDFPACTETNCNFGISQGGGYEVNINSSAPSLVNWSLVGIVYNQTNITLNKNTTDFGKNWVAMYSGTVIKNATMLIQNISNADAVTNWNYITQKSEGLIYHPFGGGFLGTNFAIVIERGYEVSVNASSNWTQV